MASRDPLKTVLSFGSVDDTSLALPSVNQLSGGQQRVKEQVQSVRRTKSRHLSSRSGSASLSPTSPSYESVFGETLRSQSGASNGSIFFGNGFSKALNLERSANRQIGNKYMGSRVQSNTTASALHYRRSYAPAVSTATVRRNTSRSEPDLAWPRPSVKRAVPPQRFPPNMGTYRPERTAVQMVNSWPQLQPVQVVQTVNGASQNASSKEFTSYRYATNRTETLKSPVAITVTDGAPKSKADPGSNGVSKAADMTMKEAVECLSQSQETYQSCGASYIQHNAFIDDKAREEVVKLNGVPLLVNLLRSPSSQVGQTASAALWNLTFQSDKVKEAVHQCNGITEAAALLRDTDSVETQKQLTGLLWNLSSAENLKPDLLKSALPVLMERVIQPFTTGSEQTSGVGRDPDAFFHATGCLRNLSSAKQSTRQAMRKCRGLVDSLVRYIGDCVEDGKPDDKSVENCMCVLHNLTFQLEVEAPALFSRITALAKHVNRSSSQVDPGPISCFSQQNKPANPECHFDFPVVEDPQPSGAGWLIHSKTLQSYLSLLSSSQKEDTQEACCGAMQNLTTHDSIVSTVMSQTIVQKLNGLSHITPLITSNKINLQKSIVALIGNLSKNRNLNNTIARKALPGLLGLLSKGTEGGNGSDDTLAMACLTANSLLMKEPEMGKHLLNDRLINSLRDLSVNNYLPKASKAAGMLLYNLWSEKDLQSVLRKQGLSKASFVNDVTTAANRSFHVVQ
ncbi:plakophilin-1-like [Betta splendens]|uniref:Plakophilin-1-like n=1 Tax=Betta splendens TaxID=158456 RepID=A0A6P7MNG2_BETSP|nr:plakophilin-1-like [Betta splendens]